MRLSFDSSPNFERIRWRAILIALSDLKVIDAISFVERFKRKRAATFISVAERFGHVFRSAS